MFKERMSDEQAINASISIGLVEEVLAEEPDEIVTYFGECDEERNDLESSGHFFKVRLYRRVDRNNCLFEGFSSNIGTNIDCVREVVRTQSFFSIPVYALLDFAFIFHINDA